MEASETVMDEAQLVALTRIDRDSVLLAQAEISFKAGYFEGRGLGLRDGIREVVEWIEEFPSVYKPSPEAIQAFKKGIENTRQALKRLEAENRQLSEQLKHRLDRTKMHEWGSPKGLPKGWRGRTFQQAQKGEK